MVNLAKLKARCVKYDNQTKHNVETCFPRSVSKIKTLYSILSDCDTKGCDDLGEGFKQSFMLAIEEANTGFESELGTFLKEKYNITPKFKMDDKRALLVKDMGQVESMLHDDEFRKHYRGYYKAIDSLNELMYLHGEDTNKIGVPQLKQVLDTFVDAALTLCVYVSSLEGADGYFSKKCEKRFKKKSSKKRQEKQVEDDQSDI